MVDKQVGPYVVYNIQNQQKLDKPIIIDAGEECKIILLVFVLFSFINGENAQKNNQLKCKYNCPNNK